MRPSYIVAVLIQRAGQVQAPACTNCRGVFAECRRVLGHFGGACGNYKWRDHGARCLFHDSNQAPDDRDKDDDSSSDDNLPPPPPLGRGGGGTRGRGGRRGGRGGRGGRGRGRGAPAPLPLRQ